MQAIGSHNPEAGSHLALRVHTKRLERHYGGGFLILCRQTVRTPHENICRGFIGSPRWRVYVRLCGRRLRDGAELCAFGSSSGASSAEFLDDDKWTGIPKTKKISFGRFEYRVLNQDYKWGVARRQIGSPPRGSNVTAFPARSTACSVERHERLQFAFREKRLHGLTCFNPLKKKGYTNKKLFHGRYFPLHYGGCFFILWTDLACTFACGHPNWVHLS